MDVLWPDLAPEAAAANLRKAVHFARQALAPEHLARDEMLRLEAAGDPDGATAALERLAAADRLSEEAVTAVIRAHALAGQRHLALRWYRQFEARLDEELGVEPGAEARRLHEDISAGRFPTAEPAAPPGLPAATDPPAEERKLVTVVLLDVLAPRARSTRSRPGWSWTGAPRWWRRCWSPGAAPPSGWSVARSWPCSASPRPTRTTRAAPSRPASSSWSVRQCRSGPASAPAR
jgi:DNA-binding SARP family transcriptional activator